MSQREWGLEQAGHDCSFARLNGSAKGTAQRDKGRIGRQKRIFSPNAALRVRSDEPADLRGSERQNHRFLSRRGFPGINAIPEVGETRLRPLTALRFGPQESYRLGLIL